MASGAAHGAGCLHLKPPAEACIEQRAAYEQVARIRSGGLQCHSGTGSETTAWPLIAEQDQTGRTVEVLGGVRPNACCSIE